MKNFTFWSLFSAVAIGGAALIATLDHQRDLANAAFRPVSIQAPASSFYQKLANVTALVDTPTGQGTGIVFSRRQADGHYVTYVLTCAHVCANAEEATVFLDKNFQGGIKFPPVSVILNGKKSECEIVAYSFHISGDDICVLRVKQLDFSHDSAVLYDGAPLEPFTPIFHVGNFFGQTATNSASEGIVSFSGRSVRGHIKDQISCPIYPGSSGGGVYTADGKCIGMAEAREEELNAIIVPARVIREFLKAKGLTTLL